LRPSRTTNAKPKNESPAKRVIELFDRSAENDHALAAVIAGAASSAGRSPVRSPLRGVARSCS
jgi:hypothetical protein